MIKDSVIEVLKNTSVYNLYCAKRYKKQCGEQFSFINENAQFKNKYLGKRCFILGNGPSLSDVDFSLLADEYVFTVNQLPRNNKFGLLKTNFHVWADQVFFNIREDKAEDQELLSVMKGVNTPNNSPVVFYEMKAYKMIKDNNLDKYLNICFFSQTQMNTILYEKRNKQLDFCRVIPDYSTVVQTAIWLAVYMGFKEIVLLGCDCTSFMNICLAKMYSSEESKYAYDISSNEKRRLENKNNCTQIKTELKNAIKMLDDYDRIYEACSKAKVKIINASNRTLIDSIPRVELEKIL